MATTFQTLAWRDGAVVMLDQRLLPSREAYNEYHSAEEVASAIRQMVVRGAPAIGCAAALGVALEAMNAAEKGRQAVCDAVQKAAALLAETRPTAVNLRWALERIEADCLSRDDLDGTALAENVLALAQDIIREDREANQRMGRFGAELLPDKVTVLTHCNAGALATAGWGTALGVIRSAREMGKDVRVYADETRPWLQGARLTAWELQKDEIPVTVIPDSAAASLMSHGEIEAVIVGADRIAANGDVANKIGTYGLAVLAERHGIPFYVAAPLSTFDPNTPTGEKIPIEERPAEEVTTIGDVRIVPEGVPVRNLAFDVTPNALVTAIVTDRGVARPPYETSLGELFSHEEE